MAVGKNWNELLSRGESKKQAVKRQLGRAPGKAVGEDSSCGNTAGVFESLRSAGWCRVEELSNGEPLSGFELVRGRCREQAEFGRRIDLERKSVWF